MNDWLKNLTTPPVGQPPAPDSHGEETPFGLSNQNVGTNMPHEQSSISIPNPPNGGPLSGK
jgi:hypothetical protein